MVTGLAWPVLPTVGVSLMPPIVVMPALLSLVLRSGPAKPADSIDRTKCLRFMTASVGHGLVERQLSRMPASLVSISLADVASTIGRQVARISAKRSLRSSPIERRQAEFCRGLPDDRTMTRTDPAGNSNKHDRTGERPADKGNARGGMEVAGL
jgi:hypothetical protein